MAESETKERKISASFIYDSTYTKIITTVLKEANLRIIKNAQQLFVDKNNLKIMNLAICTGIAQYITSMSLIK
jgi:hypothetical protein